MIGDIDGFSGHITVRKASQLYGISLEVLWKKIERGRLPALRIERTLLVRPSDVLKSQTDDLRRYNGGRRERQVA